MSSAGEQAKVNISMLRDDPRKHFKCLGMSSSEHLKRSHAQVKNLNLKGSKMQGQVQYGSSNSDVQESRSKGPRLKD